MTDQSDDGAVLAAPIPPRTCPLVVFVHGMRPANDGVLCPGDISKDYQAWERVLHPHGKVLWRPEVEVSPLTFDEQARVGSTDVPDITEVGTRIPGPPDTEDGEMTRCMRSAGCCAAAPST